MHPLKATLPVEIAVALGLEIVGDEAILSVTAVQPDGSVEVQSGPDEPVENMPAPTEIPGSNSPALASLAPAGMPMGGL